MAFVPYLCIYLFLPFLINCEVQTENTSNSVETYSSEISSVLNYLNSSSFKVYYYKDATLIYAHKKADIIELAVDVNVECVNNYPDIPCTERLLTCHAFVQDTPEGGSQVLNDVDCKPKPEIIVEEPSYEPPTSPTEAEINETKFIVLSNEAVSSEVAEPFVAVRRDMVPCLGCPFDLNPDAEGVDELIDLALEHVGSERPNKQALVKVLKVQQQVVAGVKYFLTIEIGDTECSRETSVQDGSCSLNSNSATSVCQIVYLQKPWISKEKHIIGNNCTNSQEYVKSEGRRSDMSNEININGQPSAPSVVTPNFDRIAETGEMSASRLHDLESQILGIETEEVHPNQNQNIPITQVVPIIERIEPTPSEVVPLTSEAEETAAQPEIESDLKNILSKSSEEVKRDSSNSSEESPGITESRNKRAIPQLEKISPEEKPLVKNLADFAASALDNIDDDNHKRIILQILGAKKMVGDDGVYYHLIMRMGISHCLEDKPPNPYDNCRDKLFENYTKICKVQVYVNDDFASPKVVKSQCQNIKRDQNDSNRTNYSRFKRQVLGGPSSIDVNSDTVQTLLREGVTHLNAQRNTNKHKPVEVVSATTQVVAGSLTTITTKVAETSCAKTDDKKLEDCVRAPGASPKTCVIKVWEKSWENFKQFTIKCEGDEKEYKVQTTTRSKRHVPGEEHESQFFRTERGIKRHQPELDGGPSDIDVNGDQVKTLLSEGVTHLNAQRNTKKHKPVEVISASSQVVAGFLIKIKAKLAETNCAKTDEKNLDECDTVSGASPKTCEIKVWEKSWENFKQFTITCEGDPKEYKVQTTSRSKRHIPGEEYESHVFRTKRGVPGGPSDIDVNGDQVKTLLSEGVTHLNAQRNTKKHKPVEVMSASSQVVAGSLIKIKAKLAETNCAKTDEKKLDECDTVSGASPKICEINVWEKSWENFKQFTITCEGDAKEYKVVTTSRSKRQSHGGESHFFRRKRDVIVGGQTEIDVNDARVHELLPQGITTLNEQRNNGLYKPIEVLRATTQVVSGVKTTIWVKLGETDCSQDDQKTLDECPLLKEKKPTKCRITVWEQPWRNFKQFTVKCDDDDKTYKNEIVTNRVKRQVPSEFDLPNDNLFVKKYLEEGLRRLDSQSNQENKFKVHEIVSVTKQTVSGHIFKIKAKIVASDCKKNQLKRREECSALQGAQPKTCNFRVYEALWIPNSRQMNISCDEELDLRKGSGLLGNDDFTHQFTLFTDFVTKFKKNYSPSEYKYRLKVFGDNLQWIRLLNTFEQGSATYGITRFADLTREEFSKSLGLRTSLHNENAPPFAKARIPDIKIPTEFDWRKKGAVTKVKDQGQCGSCWAFSVTGNVEGQNAIKSGQLVEFSEQELVDCDTEDQGCNGGLMDNAYREIEKLGGLESEQDYPYDAEDEKCHFNRSLVKVQVKGALNISHDEGEMAKWLYANGPISIAINANAMQFYMGGVSHPFKFLCSPNNLDHGVLIVGYGVHKYPLFNKTLPYWIVKNSWGTSWGEQGYYRVYRGDGTCGLNQTPSSAIVV